jgi:hypothetical protein
MESAQTDEEWREEEKGKSYLLNRRLIQGGRTDKRGITHGEYL